ncbi:MAG: hypothetical protein ACPF8W_05630 [Luminiphilus sp.]
MNDLPKDHPSYMTDKQQQEAIEKHIGAGQALANAAGSALIAEGQEWQKDASLWRGSKQVDCAFDEDGDVWLRWHGEDDYNSIPLDRDEVKWLRDHFDNLLSQNIEHGRDCAE